MSTATPATATSPSSAPSTVARSPALAVGSIVTRVVADRLDELRLDGLVMNGVDEISCRKAQRYLTSVADHRTGAIVWTRPGRNAATLQGFFDELGPRKGSIRAVSIDITGGYRKAVEQSLPDAEIASTPSTSSRSPAAPSMTSAAPNGTPTASPIPPAGGESSTPAGRCLRRLSAQSIHQLARLAEVQDHNRRLYRAFLLYHQLRLLYQVDPSLAAEHLNAWLTWASRSKLKPFIKLARTIRRHRSGILAAIRLGLNARHASRSACARLSSREGHQARARCKLTT